MHLAYVVVVVDDDIAVVVVLLYINSFQICVSLPDLAPAEP